MLLRIVSTDLSLKQLNCHVQKPDGHSNPIRIANAIGRPLADWWRRFVFGLS